MRALSQAKQCEFYSEELLEIVSKEIIEADIYTQRTSLQSCEV